MSSRPAVRAVVRDSEQEVKFYSVSLLVEDGVECDTAEDTATYIRDVISGALMNHGFHHGYIFAEPAPLN